MSLGGGSNNQSTTNTIAQPPAFQVPYIERMLGEAMAQYESPAPQYYPGLRSTTPATPLPRLISCSNRRWPG